MIFVQILLQFLHVFKAIFWFGSVLFVDFILIPTVQTFDAPTRGLVMGPLGARIERTYGITFIASLALGIVIIVYGLQFLRPLAQAIAKAPPGPEQDAMVARIKTLTIVELFMFLLIIVLMIAMRFGY